MAEGQTRVIHQGAESSSWDVADRYGISPGSDHWPAGVSAPDYPHETVRLAVQNEVFPRLVSAHGHGVVSEQVDKAAVHEIAQLLIRPEHTRDVDSFVDRSLGKGLLVEHLFLRLFQPAARRLGDLWLDDLCSFVDVTLGMATLQTMLRRLSPRLRRNGRDGDVSRSLLMTTMPGDQHTFGVNMAAEFFRRSGWDVGTIAWDDPDDLVYAARAGGYSVVGFSVSSRKCMNDLAAAIVAVRRGCSKRGVGILLGGPIFIEHPEFAAKVGGDAVAIDARQAVAQAEDLASRICGR